jgi:hypothetical protein
MSPPTSEHYPFSPGATTCDKLSCCLSWVRKLARRFDILPRSFVLQAVKKSEDHPFSCGGFADIYKGSYHGKPVALKVIRATTTDSFRRRIHKVTHIPYSPRYDLFPKLFDRKSRTRHYIGSISNTLTSFHFLA